MGEWSLVLNAVFQLVLQLVGINIGGSLVFRQRGLDPSLRRYDRGSQRLFYISLAITVLALAGLLAWQFSAPLRLERSSESTRAMETIRQLVQEDERVDLVSAEATFKASDANGNNTLLAIVYVQRASGHADVRSTEIEEQLTREIQAALQERIPKIVPLVQVIVLDPPSATPTSEEAESS
jgi:uncharacterized membrane protein